MASFFRIKNWKKHQHYSDRRPPWIKLHNALLDDYEFQCLSDLEKLHLVAIWLLASRSTRFHPDGDPLLPEDEAYLTRQAGLKGKISLKPLFQAGFLIRYQDASTVQAKCSSETETYKEETEREKEADPPPFTLPDEIRPEVWGAFEKHRKKLRKPMTDEAKRLIVLECRKLGGDPNALLEQSIRRGWLDVFELKNDGGKHGRVDPGHRDADPRKGEDLRAKYAGVGTSIVGAGGE